MTMNERVDVEIGRRRLSLDIEGLLPIEITGIAEMVNEKLKEVERKYPQVVDTYKLNIYALIELAAELYKREQAESMNKKVLENSINRIEESLAKSLAVAGEPVEEE